MKVIGSINIEYDENGEAINAPYIGGSIVAMTEEEMRTILLLQTAWDGGSFQWDYLREKLSSREIDNQFKAIRAFVEAKFALNEFRQAINDLEGLLKKTDIDE